MGPVQILIGKVDGMCELNEVTGGLKLLDAVRL